MSRRASIQPLAALRRQCCVPPHPGRALCQHIQKRSYASSNEEKPEFKAQLWESTAARVKKERAEQARWARGRNTGGSSLALGIGLTTTVMVASGFSYYLGSLNSAGFTDRSTLPLSISEQQTPEHNITTANLQEAWTEIRDIVGLPNLSTTESDLLSHSGSAWSSYQELDSDQPFCIVKPGSTDEVSRIMKVCHARHIPVTPYSGGTSLEGHFAATRGGICVDFSRMDKMIALHADDMDCVVQPAMSWETLNYELEKQDLFFPPDPGPGAMIGGMVGTGCSGTNAYHYGTMKDWVLSLTVVLADGTVIKTRQRPRKSSAGYDLTRTFIGSEGTLGLVTEATLKLTAKAKNPRVAVCCFPTVRAAADCVAKVVRSGIPVAAVELLDDVQMKCINDAGMTTKSWKEAPTLFFKFSGATPNAVKDSITAVQKHAKAAGSQSFEFAKDEEEAGELWQARKEALWSVTAKKREESDRVWTTDVAVPVSRLPDIIEETKADIQKTGLLASIVGHVGDGNFHTIILYNEKERDTAKELVHRMVKRAIEMEGTATGEHGVGLVKRDYLEHEMGTEAVDTMRMLKRAFDPLNLLNPDKVVRSRAPGKGEEVSEW